MSDFRRRLVASFAVAAVGAGLLAGCSASTTADVVKAVSTSEACAQLHREINPAEIAMKKHLTGAAADTSDYQAAMDDLSHALITASKKTTNRVVSARARTVGDDLGQFIVDFNDFSATRSKSAAATVHDDNVLMHSDDAAFQTTCGFLA